MAIPMFEQAARKDPGNPIYQYHLGLALLKNGERQKARVALEQVVREQSERAAGRRRAQGVGGDVVDLCVGDFSRRIRWQFVKFVHDLCRQLTRNR